MPQAILVLITGLPGTGKSTLADRAARQLGAAVHAHDWAMSGLRPYPELQSALDSMDPPGHRDVGWSILYALADSQLRRGASVVLDGVARAPEIARCRGLADERAATAAVVLAECRDVDTHRTRIEGRQRDIPNWYELDWAHVARSRGAWQPIRDADLELDATDDLGSNLARLDSLLESLQAP
jgi:hypothetical protein